MRTNKWMLIVLGAFVLNVGVILESSAREILATEFELSAFGAGVFPADEDEDATVYAGGRLLYNLNEIVGVGVESGWMNFEQTEGGLDYGDARGIPLLAEVVFRMPVHFMEDDLIPYLLAGAGVTFWDFDESSVLTGNGISVDDDTAFTAKAAIGADYFFTENIAVFIEGGYMWSDWDGAIRGGGLVADATVDTDMAFVGGGIKLAY